MFLFFSRSVGSEVGPSPFNHLNVESFGILVRKKWFNKQPENIITVVPLS